MRKALQVIKKLGKDEDGAALVEYTVLLGIMLVAVSPRSCLWEVG